MLSTDVVPLWVVVIGACVPNFVIGVLLLVFRSRIVAGLSRVFPKLNNDSRFHASRFIGLGGAFFILMSSGLLVFQILQSAG